MIPTFEQIHPYIGEREPAFYVKMPMTPRILWPNIKPNRHVKAKAVAKMRLLAKTCFMRDIPDVRYPVWEPMSHVVIGCVGVFKTNRRRDARNFTASLKSVDDGMVDAGVVMDDSPEYISWLTPQMIYMKGIKEEYIAYNIYDPEVLFS